MNVHTSEIHWGRIGPRVIPAAGAFAVLSLALCLAITPCSAAENVPAHASADRSGEVPIGNARTFSLMAGMGSVHILPQPANSSGMVRYTVHLETDAQEPVSRILFDHFVLNSRNTGAPS